MTELYLVRHAQAEGNLYRRMHGQYDSLITDFGRRQIEALERRFATVEIDAVYSSDLIRAKETAAAIYRPKNLPLHTTPALREVCLGVWEDMCWGEAEQNDSEQLLLFNRHPQDWHVEGSESWQALTARIVGAVLDIARENEGRRVAVVSHGTAIRALLVHLFHADPGDVVTVPHSENTAVTLLHIENGQISVVYMNDDSHLPDELNTFRRETWWKSADGRDGRNMHFLPFDLKGGKEDYLACYRDSWINAHGSDLGFGDGSFYLMAARFRAAFEPKAVAEAWLGQTSCGIVELAIEETGTTDGHIAFFYLRPEFRGRGFAPQLLGYAVSYYRAKGREKLTLRVAQENRRAYAFYERNGFVPRSEEHGMLGTLILMEKDIRRP